MAKVETERRGPVTIATINRPEVHNCFDGETADLMTAAIESFASDDDARVLVVTGAGDLAFCSGADLKAPGSLIGRADAERTAPMGFAKLDPGKPAVAAIEGYCFAGGFELAAWCDFRIAGETAEFGCLSRRWGVNYVDGGTQRFPRIMGTGNALYLLETGMRIDARRARDMGFVQEVVAPGAALPRALELAERIADYPGEPGLRADRASTLAAFGLPLEQGLEMEGRDGLAALGDPSVADGLARFVSGDRPDAPRPAG
ncbi:MAG: enoyl-CoA hydratase-related protein [Actinomycetota bacterium]